METKKKPYIFISYAHTNEELVLPAIQEMHSQGISLWYDNGIEAGSEWPEYIAEKVMNCDKFVLFISKAYLQSQNCKRELNFAISRKKDILSVFLEDVELSPGMEMQLGTYQAIFRNRFSSHKNFYVSLAKEPFFNTCREYVHAPQVNNVMRATTSAKPQRPMQSQLANEYYSPVTAPTEQLPLKSKTIAGILAILLGGLGIHKFYLGKTLYGILYLVFFWTYIPTIAGIIEGIIMLAQKDEAFTSKYHCRLK